MTVNTAKVSGRRKLRFESLDEVLAEAERLAAANDVRTLGNWTLGQILQHLATSYHMAIDGSSFKPPWYIRIAARLIRGGVIHKKMSAGFKLPPGLAKTLVAPDSITTAAGIQALRDAIERFRREPQRKPHAAFGKLTDEEWEKLQLRHAELHFSFVVTE